MSFIAHVTTNTCNNSPLTFTALLSVHGGGCGDVVCLIACARNNTWKCGHTKVDLTDSSKLALTCMYLHTYRSGMLRVSTSVLFINPQRACARGL